MAHPYQSFFQKSTTLQVDASSGATSMTLAQAAFGSPSGKQILVINRTGASPEIIRGTISGTSVTGIERGLSPTSAVAHTAGAEVAWVLEPNLLSFVMALDGWRQSPEAWTRTGALTMTTTVDLTGTLSPGSLCKVTDTTTKYFEIASVTATTVTFSSNGVYTLSANPTAVWFSNRDNPVGAPLWLGRNSFNGWIPLGVNGTYVSATQFTLVGDWTSVIKKYSRLELTNSTVKYLLVTSISHSTGTTTVNVTGGTTYTLASAAITNISFSNQESPTNWPLSFAYAVTATVNLSGSPANNSFRFMVSTSGLVFMRGIYNGGVTATASASVAISVPLAASKEGNLFQHVPCLGTIATQGMRYVFFADSSGTLTGSANYAFLRNEGGTAPTAGQAIEYFGGFTYQAE